MILIKWFLFLFSFFLITLGWRPWASWSSCSAECEGGHQTRRRLCVRDVPNACEGDAKQKRQCNLFDCGGTIWFDLIWFDMTSMIRAVCLNVEVYGNVLIFILIRSNFNCIWPQAALQLKVRMYCMIWFHLIMIDQNWFDLKLNLIWYDLIWLNFDPREATVWSIITRAFIICFWCDSVWFNISWFDMIGLDFTWTRQSDSVTACNLFDCAVTSIWFNQIWFQERTVQISI